MRNKHDRTYAGEGPSPSFYWEEAACVCCRKLPREKRLAVIRAAQMLEEIQALFEERVHIYSWYRCEEENARLGSNELSHHRSGRAIDFGVSYTSPKMIEEKVKDLLRRDVIGGLGVYETWVHADNRQTGRGRWWEGDRIIQRGRGRN